MGLGWQCTLELETSVEPLHQTSIVREIVRGSLLDVRTSVPLTSIFANNESVIDGVELMFVGIGFICVPAAVISYARINKKRDEVQRQGVEKGERNKYTAQELRRMGDRAPDFRYTI